MVERLDDVAVESSNGWNCRHRPRGAGRGYTPERADGSIDIAKAVAINESFQISRQFWAYHVQKGNLSNPQSFIHSAAHEFCLGRGQRRFPAQALPTLRKAPLFRGMNYSEDRDQIAEWIPLVMNGVTASRKWRPPTDMGTDVNFGEVTRQLIAALEKKRISACVCVRKCAISSA